MSVPEGAYDGSDQGTESGAKWQEGGIPYNQWPRSRGGLETDVRMVKICSRHTKWHVKLIIEKMARRNGPLGGLRSTIGEGSCCHGEAMPMLVDS